MPLEFLVKEFRFEEEEASTFFENFLRLFPRWVKQETKISQ